MKEVLFIDNSLKKIILKQTLKQAKNTFEHNIKL